jgi:hypothetical protein
MELIQEKTLKTALRMLDAIKAEYAIRDVDGGMHGTLTIERPKHKRSYAHPYGERSEHARKHVENLGIGQIAYVPCQPYGRNALASTLIPLLIRMYGKEGYKTCYNKKDDCVEVVRYS